MNFDACILVITARKWALLHKSHHTSLSRQTPSLGETNSETGVGTAVPD